jgi:hypothetical protein
VRYLEYNWEKKKQIKIEENEVYSLLNDNLRDKITVYLNGRLLHNIQVFDSFSIEFLSKVTFIFKKRSYTVDDLIFNVSFDQFLNMVYYRRKSMVARCSSLPMAR